jgi:hypothetical protein
MFESGKDSRFQHSLLTDRQRSQLPLGIIGDGYFERHGTALSVPAMHDGRGN